VIACQLKLENDGKMAINGYRGATAGYSSYDIDVVRCFSLLVVSSLL
jgi:hypothetical protein